MGGEAQEWPFTFLFFFLQSCSWISKHFDKKAECFAGRSSGWLRNSCLPLLGTFFYPFRGPRPNCQLLQVGLFANWAWQKEWGQENGCIWRCNTSCNNVWSIWPTDILLGWSNSANLLIHLDLYTVVGRNIAVGYIFCSSLSKMQFCVCYMLFDLLNG